jgi:hypothetical protein
MPKFKITRTYEMTDYGEIEADDEDEAQEKAENGEVDFKDAEESSEYEYEFEEIEE